jgi:hypothetical protein
MFFIYLFMAGETPHQKLNGTISSHNILFCSDKLNVADFSAPVYSGVDRSSFQKNRRQGIPEPWLQGCKGIAGLPPEVTGPRGRYLTGLVKPCGALPRKCYLFIPFRKHHRHLQY